jgi:Xaa-Pro aminopeptidase
MSLGTRPDIELDQEQQVKRGRVLAVLEQAGVDAVALTSSPSLSWYLGGARSQVSLAADPVLCVRVGRDGDEVFVTDNETPRLRREELPAGMTLHERPWFAPLPDLQAAPERSLEDELRRARSPLLPRETERFRRLGHDAAHVLTEVLGIVSPEWSERQLAAEVARGLVELGAEPLVVLVGGEARADLPHPLPTAGPIGSRVLVVVCARRHGLIVNLSRLLALTALTAAERDLQERLLLVERAAFTAATPGTRLSWVLQAIAQAYAALGFGRDHWRGHHQGGAAGYAGRDPRATPDCDFLVGTGQAFAWNPWAPGGKVEDTVLLTDTGIEVLSLDQRWPTVSVDGLPRPVVWER